MTLRELRDSLADQGATYVAKYEACQDEKLRRDLLAKVDQTVRYVEALNHYIKPEPTQ